MELSSHRSPEQPALDTSASVVVAPEVTVPPVYPSAFRLLADFLVILLIGILFTRTFMAEAYIVPTGSMAPTLLGAHQTFTCPNCQHRFSLGLDLFGTAGRPVCPNCGLDRWEDQAGMTGSGDRLLVQKYLF